VGAFLTLPDSFQPSDQILDQLIKRPYWAKGQEVIAPGQAPGMFINLAFLALGLAWAWKNWKWAGFSPLFVFIFYALSLGISRTSGSRYLVPIDWAVHFYFILGLVLVFHLLPDGFQHLVGAQTEVENKPSSTQASSRKWTIIGMVILFLFLGALVPVAQNMIPLNGPLCQPIDEQNLMLELKKQGAPGDFRVIYGNVLYPTQEDDRLDFVILTCEKYYPLSVQGFREKLKGGQVIIAGITGSTTYPTIVLIALPSAGIGGAQLIWKEQ
jgi:hypothetical protein